MRKKKGFTLIELIIVVAIFGVLLLIAIPAWTTYLQRAKIRTQNAKAKAIFNAAQTAITDIDFQERKYRSIIDGPSGANGYSDKSKENAKTYLYTPVDKDEIWYFYWDGKSGYRLKPNNSKADYSGSNAAVMKEMDGVLGNAIKKIVDDQMVYKISVKNYQVLAVACAANETDTYIGTHPVTLFDYEKKTGDNIDKFRKAHVIGIDLSKFILS